MAATFDCADAEPGRSVKIGFSDGTLLGLCWERDQSPRIYVLKRGRGAKLECGDGDGTLSSPCQSVVLSNAFEWCMVNAELVKPLVDPGA